MKEHVTILGVLYIAFSAQGLAVAGVVLVAVTGSGFLSGDPDAIAITSTVGVAVASFLFLLHTPGLIGGVGLLKHYPWARYVVLVLGCLNLVVIPFGTILGVYTIWVLINPEAAVLFESPPVAEGSSTFPRK